MLPASGSWTCSNRERSCPPGPVLVSGRSRAVSWGVDFVACKPACLTHRMLLVLGFTISLDGYGAGPNQTLKEPLGVGGEALHDWLVQSRTFARMTGREGGDTGIDDDFAATAMTNIG